MLLRIEHHPNGPRVHVGSLRVHHGPVGVLVVAGALATHHELLALAGVAIVLDDLHDFPWRLRERGAKVPAIACR